MKVLKSYVRNCACPKGYIVECYLAEECARFYSTYIKQATEIGAQHGHNEDFVSETILEGRLISSGQPITVPDDLLEIAHRLLWFNNVEVQPFLE